MKEVEIPCGPDRKPIEVCFHSDEEQLGSGACITLMQWAPNGGDLQSIDLPLEAVKPLRAALKGMGK